MPTRKLGRSDLHVSPLGLGCWAIGGPFWRTDGTTREPMGWGQVDDAESIRAIHRALDLGVNLFDTANNYGAGHSERVLGQALAGRRQQAVIATKFASVFDEATKTHFDTGDFPMTRVNIEAALDDSLRRLNTDYIDLYQLHHGSYPIEDAPAVRGVLEDLVQTGKIRWYGWSTDDPARARVFAAGPHCAAIQHRLNFLNDTPEMLAVCDEFDVASINKGPLGSGLLTGKYDKTATFPPDDGRHGVNLSEGRLAERMDQLERVRGVLAEGGRTIAQGALGWIWARSPRTVPIPGFKNEAQATENAAAITHGPLSPDQMQRLDALLGR